MKKASEYRSHAEECRAMARKVTNTDQRVQLTMMAETWEELAAEREQRLHSGQSPAGLAGKARREPGGARKGSARSGSGD